MQRAPGERSVDSEPALAVDIGFQPLREFHPKATESAFAGSPVSHSESLAWQPISVPTVPQVLTADSTVSVLESSSQLPLPASTATAHSPSSANNPSFIPFAPVPPTDAPSFDSQVENAALPANPARAPQFAALPLNAREASTAEAIVTTDFSVLGNNPSLPRREATIATDAPVAPLLTAPLGTTTPFAPAPPLLNEPAGFNPPAVAANIVPAATTPVTPSGPKSNPATGYLLESLKPARTNDGVEVPPTLEDFSSPPTNYNSFDPSADMQIYQGKQLYATQRPLLELGRPWYQLGQLPPPQSWFGLHNPVSQQFLIFGDVRSAVAANQLGGDSQSLFAYQANLFFDWRFTGTERVHFNINPFTQGANNSRYLFDDDKFISELNADLNFGFFEGDLGAIVGGWTNTTLPFDLPFALGVMPLVIQNGIWLDDAFLGAAVTLPARNSPLLDISNYDVTFFAGWDKLDSPAFGADDNAAKVYGTASWLEALNGYIEADYAFVEDRDSARDRSYHNIGLGYTRRFGHLLSNSTRVIVNAGQSTLGGPNTADGVLLLSENSLITANPSTILPYFNLFAGFDRPQSVGRAGIAGGILRNTGILFETDNLTGYPTLDATANQTYGMAMGLSMMPQNFSQQLVLEGAMLGVMGDDVGRNAVAAQRGLGFRYQLPLSNSVIFRVDGMYGFLAETEDISGLRVELRRKF